MEEERGNIKEKEKRRWSKEETDVGGKVKERQTICSVKQNWVVLHFLPASKTVQLRSDDYHVNSISSFLLSTPDATLSPATNNLGQI